MEQVAEAKELVIDSELLIAPDLLDLVCRQHPIQSWGFGSTQYDG